MWTTKLNRKNSASLATVLTIVSVVALSSCSPQPFVEDNETRDRVLERYFTPEAREILGKVPLRVGELDTLGGLAVGDDIGSRIMGLYLGYPWERQVIVVDGSPDELIFHEYVHQAEYSGLITIRELLGTLALPDYDPQELAFANWVEESIEESYGADPITAIALAYNDGLNRELLAYLAEYYTFDDTLDWPEQLKSAYSVALRFDSKATPQER